MRNRWGMLAVLLMVRLTMAAFQRRLRDDLQLRAVAAGRGWSIAVAGSTVSIVLWPAMLSVPLGGLFADRTGRPDFVLVAGCIVFAMLMIGLPRSGAVVLTVVGLGLVSGQPAGPILSLPARVLRPATRAIGMGLF